MPHTSNPPRHRSSLWGALVSLAFWLGLLLSTACLAAVALAPKWVQSQRLSEQFADNQHRLVALERQTIQLQQVVTALNADPAFAEELTRIEFDAFRPGEEVLPVDPALRLDPHRTAADETRPATIHSPWQPLLVRLSSDQELRSTLLWTAALLVIAIFTWLQDPGDGARHTESAPPRPSLWQSLRTRYTRS